MDLQNSYLDEASPMKNPLTKNFRRGLLMMVVAVGPLAVSNSASAQYGCGGLGWGWCGVGQLYQVLADNVPYYSAFPPVYYSYPVPRTYGYSPFAYLPTEKTPDVEMEAAPVSISNPYFKDNVSPDLDATTPAVDRTAHRTQPVPLVIHNPYIPAAGVEFDGGPMLQAATREW